MKDLILKWWNREWSNWEHCEERRIYLTQNCDRPHTIYDIYKRVSNDGLVQYKKIKI